MATVPTFQRLNFRDAGIQRFQNNCGSVFDVLSRVDILNGNLIKGVAVPTSNVLVPHGLARLPVGWIIVAKYGAGDVYEVIRNASDLTLIGSVAVTVDLWVF